MRIILYPYARIRLRVHRAPGIPRALCFRRAKGESKLSGAWRRGAKKHVCMCNWADVAPHSGVIARLDRATQHSEASAIVPISRGVLDPRLRGDDSGVGRALLPTSLRRSTMPMQSMSRLAARLDCCTGARGDGSPGGYRREICLPATVRLLCMGLFSIFWMAARTVSASRQAGPMMIARQPFPAPPRAVPR